ncbi:hypothetical protein [Faecalibacterium sp. An122]|uniref:hypothetical protein n=1 Tax=Faecalibacterium sp. An122 TaxID=1965551 RepID=UPI000B39CF3E|nr:hypothetical protein [Faecalibacterium sp. An122]OUQ37899.1 hypothetical protein B5E67_06595 [Faecalibacterium sp. An122]
MKLKKIASLMLAGVMAVSMLAGCKGNGTNDAGSSSSEQTVVSGFSATLAAKLGDTVDEDYISVKDNAADVTALEKALNYISEPTLQDLAEKKTVQNLGDHSGKADVANMIADFMDRAGFTLDDGKIGVDGLDMTYYAENHGYDNRTVKDGTIYIVNGAVGEDEAVKLVAAEVKEVLQDEDALPKHNDITAGQDKYDYEYVISASVATKALDDTYVGAANSVVFVAVTVTRTASAD